MADCLVSIQRLVSGVVMVDDTDADLGCEVGACDVMNIVEAINDVMVWDDAAVVFRGEPEGRTRREVAKDSLVTIYGLPKRASHAGGAGPQQLHRVVGVAVDVAATDVLGSQTGAGTLEPHVDASDDG